MSKYVFCKFSIEGFHRWEDAPKYSSEEYLQSRHRHMFFVKCKASVDGDDREIEFISMRRAVKAFLVNNWKLPCEFDKMSCEMIAEAIIKFLKSKYGDRKYEVEVSEDNENGSVVIG